MYITYRNTVPLVFTALTFNPVFAEAKSENSTVESGLEKALLDVSQSEQTSKTTSDILKLEKITIEGAATANDKPVGTFNSPISNLEYDPRVDLQSRNMAEAQADVTIRGGIFENTGFRIGSATLIDPQTGHYFAEIPIAPEMLTKPSIFTGVDNALYGVNSSVGTVSYGWRSIQTAGSVSVGVGNNNFNLQRVHGAVKHAFDDLPGWSVGVEGEYSRSESDGTIANGDHDFERASGRIQLTSDDSQTDLFYGFQQKFFGWPNLYTPFNVNETEDIQTRLVMLNHKQRYGEKGMVNTFEVSAYYRENDDHYVFSRENPEAFQAFHETQVESLAISGTHNVSQEFGINYAAQFTADEITSTTLENSFTSRDYYKISVVPEYRAQLNSNESLTVRLGGAFDDTNRDDDRLSFVGDISWLAQTGNNASRTLYLSYAEATQVAGYTAVGGSTSSGLFRSNNQLQREVSKNLEFGASFDESSFKVDTALFYRWDNELTDWTYSFDSTSARSANPVDIETLGVEVIAIKRFESADVVASYTYLDKSEDYRIDEVDASFYALNYPPHRATLGLVWFATDTVEVRIDNEWRKQETNALRNGDDSAFFSHVTFTYSPAQIEGLNLVLAVDNLWDERFEEIPGTPGRGDQYSATVTYFW